MHVVGYVFLGLLALVVAAVLAVVVSAAPDLARYQRIRRM